MNGCVWGSQGKKFTLTVVRVVSGVGGGIITGQGVMYIGNEVFREGGMGEVSCISGGRGGGILGAMGVYSKSWLITESQSESSETVSQDCVSFSLYSGSSSYIA